MAATRNKTIPSHQQWLFGLLAACLLVFQTSNIVHSLDVAAHDADPDCEICDLFVGSSDDIDPIPVANNQFAFAPAIVESQAFEYVIGGSSVEARRIRAPPYSS